MPSEGKRRARAERGFTLLEVLVAFTIFAIVLAAVMQIFSTGTRNAEVSRSYVLALAEAQMQLARLGIEQPLIVGEESGELDNGMRWRRVVAPHDVGEVVPEGLPVAFDVAVSVSWRDGGRERRVSLSTLRLALPEER